MGANIDFMMGMVKDYVSGKMTRYIFELTFNLKS